MESGFLTGEKVPHGGYLIQRPSKPACPPPSELLVRQARGHRFESYIAHLGYAIAMCGVALTLLVMGHPSSAIVALREVGR